MKIHCKKDDSLYKIFSMLKKIPPYKKVSIFIDGEHEMFNHKRRSQQLADLIKEQHINATFLVNNKEQFEYFDDVGLIAVYNKKTGIYGVIETIKDLINSKSATKQLLAKKNAKSYLIFLSEIAVLLLFGTFFRGLISPKATISITPANEIIPIIYQYGFYPVGGALPSSYELRSKIVIPYHTESVEYNQEMTVDVQDIVYTYTQARGTVSFENTLPNEVSLIGGTQLVTTGGILFTIDSRVNVPPGSEDSPGRATVAVTARPNTDDGLPIGEQSNLERSTVLYIKNLSSSIDEQQIVAYAASNFTGGETTGKGTVIQDDIDSIEGQIIESMRRNKTNHLREQIRNRNNILLLPYEDLMNLTIDRFISTSTVGDSATFVHGVVSGRVEYTYIYKEDFINAVETFLTQRPLQGKYRIAYNEQSIMFHEFRPDSENPGYFSIPMSINSIRGYNFIDDQFGLTETIVHDIQGKSRAQAREILLGYDEIRDVSIRFSPPWYDTLPTDTSRISIK